MVCYCRSKADLYCILDFLDRFRRYSGLAIYEHKTKLLQLGGYDSEINHDMPFEVVKDMVLLGVHVGRRGDAETTYRWNFEERLHKCRQICGNWTNRNLFIKGKMVVINSLFIPLLLYPASISFTPEGVFTEFKNIICTFIWSSRINRIAYATMCRKK